ncbi:ATP-binding protein [Arthrobacter sp. I2-34]|uniref:histidine kinase n=1 Tax=Arthrobacter hankyongi TaxID=2904801 RepID=A0ABS9L1M7_9MICC|nr:ATP-binding protein [Arthrobacter hankyongi]MCG2620561.1 ATP-binding protein [Arthrobacter hankyongi]
MVESDTAALPAVGRKTALIADGDPQVRELAAAALTDAGLTVHAVADGPAALEALYSQAPDVALLDADLPGIPGLEVLRRIRDEGDTGCPVILLAGGPAGDLVEGAFDLGINDYVLKPFTDEQLAHRTLVTLARSARKQHERRTMGALRASTRRISAAIRETNDPYLMVELAVSGLGRAFGACSVWLYTFDDERAPLVDTTWAPDGAADFQHPPEDKSRELAQALWNKGTVLTGGRDAEEDHDGHPSLSEWATVPKVHAVAVAPLGHGGGAFGLVWMVKEGAAAVWSQAETSLLQHVAGNLAHGLIQGHLITAQQQVVERLQELDTAKNNFVATVNHELRTPITSIAGYLDLVLEGAGGEVPEGAVRMLEVVVRNASRLRELIEDLLMLSRMDFDDAVSRSEPVRIGQLLDAVATALVPVATAKDVSLVCNNGMDLVVDGDAKKLEQVLTNVVSNAVKFTPANGQVHMDIEQETHEDGSDWAVIRVSDTGIGIPAEDLPNLFHRFFRASNALTIQGTGLGLAIAKGVVQQHGGDLTVESAVGKGTTFSVQLPLTRVSDASPRSLHPEKRSAG